MKGFKTILYTIILLSSVGGCAIEMAPTGGEQDKEHPKFIGAKPDNESLNFKGNRVKIKFNEYLDNSINPAEIQVSPEMEKPPMFYVENKTLNILFKEKLKENTTYNFQFGNNVKDLSEKNVLPNFSYCFSTGDSLDLGYISGKVEYSSTLKIPENSVIGLYIDSNYSKKPNYFCKCNEDGNFAFKNIKKGKYNIISFEDINGNRIFDYGDGNAGFYNSIIELTDTIRNVNIKLFFAEKKKFEKLESKGDLNFLALKRSETIKEITADSTTNTLYYQQNSTNDSVFIWSKTTIDSIKYYIAFNDTIITIKGKANNLLDTIFLEKDKMTARSPVINISISANHPLREINISKLKVLEDSIISIENKKIKSQINFRSVMLSFPKKENRDYYVIFEDSALVDVFSNYNKTQIQKLRTGSENDFGNLLMKIDNKIDKSLIVELFDESGKMAGREIISPETKRIKFSGLEKGSYSAIGTIDENKNGYWDSGNFEKRIQPEIKILLKDKIEIKGGWDVEAEIKF